MQIEEKCLKCGRQIPWVCFCGNLVLAIFKISVGIISGSRGLVADGMHSGSDVLATVMVIISLKIADKKQNRKHPWGYGKAEYVGSLLVYTILLILGGVILFDAAKNMILGTLEPPHMISMFAAMVSIVANVILSSYGFCAGRRLNSPAMIANANENKADLLSSIAVVMGIAGAQLGYAFADPLAAIVVALLIIRMSAALLIEAVAGLMDKAVDEKAVRRIKQIALNNREVSGICFVKARKLGGKAWVEMEILIDPKYSVVQANTICYEVRNAILRKAFHIKDVVISFSADPRKSYKPNRSGSKNRIFNFTQKIKV